MKKYLIYIILLCFFTKANGQIQVSKLTGKNSDLYKTGVGGFLKFQIPVTEGSYITFEGSANVFNLKTDPSYALIVLPIKAGYKYLFNHTSRGLYVEPQLGYNALGIDEHDVKFTGPVLAAGLGYIVPIIDTDIDFGLIYETALRKGGAVSYLSFRISHSFGFGKKKTTEE